MIVHVSTSTLQRMKWHQYAVRFVFGGTITAVAGIIAQKFGPALGGLFLAFPAIFPAAATLAQSHEEEKKKEKGLSGKQRGILVAGDQAFGSALGSIALAVFGAIFWLAVPRMSLLLLFPLAIVAWLTFSMTLWFVHKRIHIFHRVRPLSERAGGAATPLIRPRSS